MEGDIYGIPTEQVEEFTAVGVGGLALSGVEKAVVVSMGTGTAFVWAQRGGEVRHLCGSGVGGGTLLLVYMTAFAGVEQRLAQGINLLYFLPAGLLALPAHVKNGYIEKPALLPAIGAGLACAALAAWAATAMEVGLLKKLFGAFLIVVGLMELFTKPDSQSR